MNRRIQMVLLISAILAGFAPPPAPAQELKNQAAEKIYVIPVNGQVDVSMIYIIRRGLKEAMDQKASAIILDMDTYGGDAMATEEILTILSKYDGKTATYINTKAISAGAFISFGTGEIYMAPGSSIGAAAIITSNPGEEIPTRVVEKYSSAFRGIVRSKAEKFGHNPAVIDAMVDQDKGLTVDGKEILPKGKLLTLTTQEAVKKYGKPPKPLVAKAEAKSVEEVAEKMGLKGAKIVRIEPTGAESIARFITMISPILLMIGIGAIYMEAKTPGFGLAGSVALICFAIFFFGHYIAGIAGYEAVVLFFIGFLLIAVEIFHPGLLIPGVLGVIAVVVALFMGMADFYPTGSWTLPEMPNLMVPTMKMVTGFLLAIVLIFVLNKVIPEKTYARSGLVLEQTMDPAQGFTSSGPSKAALIGKTGRAVTSLRPAGTALIDDNPVDVVTDGFHIEKGCEIRVVSVEGAKVVVEKA